MEKIEIYELKAAHKCSIYNREELLSSNDCGCYYCLKIYKAADILEFVDDSKTALCPYCGIDSVNGEKSGFPIKKEFLNKMNEYWFGGV